MRFALAPFIGLVAAACAASADPPTYAPWPGGRAPERIHKCDGGRVLDRGPEMARARDRLDRDAHSGRLAPDQAHKLKHELEALNRDEARACAKGYLTETELRDLGGRLQHLADDLGAEPKR